MHGEGEERKRSRHMWPVPAPSTAAASDKPAVILLPPSLVANSFLKDGRKIRVGDCALFQAGNAPPFIGIISWFTSVKEAYLKLCVNWLYRPADLKLAKGILLEAAPNEVFYSFHKDIICAASLLHPCKVAFLRKGVELPLGISSFICRRVYDIENKCLWWLNDQDFLNEHQEEVAQLLDKTHLEMHAAVQSGGHSPKRMNGPAATQQLKSGSDGVQNSGTSFSSQIKGKKRDRVDSITEPSKRVTSKSDDGIFACCKFDNNMLKSEILKITDKGALISTDGVEKLIQLMRVDNNSKKIDLTGRVLLADVIAATDRIDCLNRFVQIRGVPVLDEWLQEAHKGKTGDGNSSKECDRAFEELLLSLLRALDKLPVNLNALQTCNIGKSVNHLRGHKNLEIQKKARSLVDTWKKRVDAEMKTNDAKPIGSNQSVTWPVKSGFPEVSHVGNRRSGSGELSIRNSITQQSTFKGLAGKSVHADAVKSTIVFVGPGKLQSSLLPVGTSLKDSLSKAAVDSGTTEVPQTVAKEEKSSSSSQSQNNSQSCSGDHGKTVGSSLKEDARSSTAGSVNAGKASGGSSHNRKSGNGFVASNISGGPKEYDSSKSGLLIRNSTIEKLSQAGISCERTEDAPASDHCISHRLIVRLPNPSRSPVMSTSGGSLEDPSSGSRASSPLLDKHEHGDHKVIGRKDTGQSHIAADVNAESWQSNRIKEALIECDEGNRLSTIMPDEEQRAADETARAVEISRSVCSLSSKGPNMAEPKMRNSFSSMNALIESCAKYSEATAPLSGGDAIGMNLLASVAAGERSKSDVVSPVSSPGGSPGTVDHCSGNNEVKSRFPLGDSGCQTLGSDDNAELDPQKHGKDNAPVVLKGEIQEMCLNFPGNNKGITSLLEDKAQQSGLLSAVKGKFLREEENPDQFDQRTGGQVGDGSTYCKSEVRNPVDQIKNISSVLEKVAEGGSLACDSGHKSLSHGVDCEVSASGRNDEKAVIGESSFDHPLDKDVKVAVNLIGQKSNSIAQTETKLMEIKVDDLRTSLVAADKVPYPENEDLLKDKKFGGLDDQCQVQTETYGSAVVMPNNKGDTGSASSPLGINVAEIIERKVSIENYGAGSGDHHQLRTIIREAEACPKRPAADVERKEDLASSAEISSSVTITEQDAGSKLDFDLNEGILGDDVSQSESSSISAPVQSHAITKSSVSPLPSSAILNELPSPITIAAPAKGPFMPPENLLKSKAELGWRGSAATSAFRPAEPRKVLEMQLITSDAQSSDIAIARQGRPALEIDLNFPDDRALEDMVSQNSAQTTSSESGVNSNLDIPSRDAEWLDLDLNRVDEGAEFRQLLASTSCRLEVPFLSARAATVGLPSDEANMLRDFDLNNGPGIEDVGAEPFPKSQNTKSRNNMPFVPHIAGLRVNNSELGAAWFPPGNSYPAVAIPSFLPDNGEQHYPIVAAAGTQRFLGSVTGAGSFGSDIYRGSVLSSSPAMTFSPAATAFSYAGFPFSPLASTSFSTGSINYVDSLPSGSSYSPSIASSLVGATGAVSSPYVRPYVISLPENSSGGSESRKKWGRQGLDLNTGPGSVEEVKDNRLPSSRQLHAASSQSFIEDQARLYQVAGAVKRKEPDGGWVPDRFTFKQPSWQ